jgi:hypothetical protein
MKVFTTPTLPIIISLLAASAAARALVAQATAEQRRERVRQ